MAASFCSGVHALDDYFARHALANDRNGISTAYVLRRTDADPPAWPRVIGYYTLSTIAEAFAEEASMLEIAQTGQ